MLEELESLSNFFDLLLTFARGENMANVEVVDKALEQSRALIPEL